MFAWFNEKSNYDSCKKNPKHELTGLSMWAQHSHTQLLPINSSCSRWFGDRKFVTIKYWNLKNQVRWGRVTQLSVQATAKLCDGVRRLIFSSGLDVQHTREMGYDIFWKRHENLGDVALLLDLACLYWSKVHGSRHRELGLCEGEKTLVATRQWRTVN